MAVKVQLPTGAIALVTAVALLAEFCMRTAARPR